jgi:hypothetical protein
LLKSQKIKANTIFDEVVDFVKGPNFDKSSILILESYRKNILSLPIFSDSRSGEMYKIRMCYDSIDARINLMKKIESDKDNNNKYHISLYVSLIGLVIALAALLLSYFPQPTVH